MNALAALVAVAWLVARSPGASLVAALHLGAKPLAVIAPLDARTVLARYRTALALLHRPKAISFEFALAQLGLHDMEQTHRVYRSGRSERDETLSIDGYRLKSPAVRIITGRMAHYDIATLAPRPQVYRFVPVSAIKTAAGYRYLFRTVPLRPRAFAVREVELDGRTFLPSVLRFTTSANGARGMGELRYGPADGYWVIREATVSATLRGGKPARERIVWSAYRFPSALPADTFRVPRPQPTSALVPGGVPATSDPSAHALVPNAIPPP